MKTLQTLMDPRVIRWMMIVLTLTLFVLGAAAPGSPGDIGIH